MAARSNGGLAQLGEHLPCKQGVESSNLLVSTIAMVLFVATIFRTYLENRILKIQDKDIRSKSALQINYAKISTSEVRSGGTVEIQ